MPLHILTEKLWFPPAEDAMSDGLLAMGGDLNTDRLLLAYKSGIFPWYDNDLPLWWHPDPRFVLFPNELIVSKSMKQLIKQKAFQFTTNTAFEAVINNCKTISRKDQDGTWINEDVKKAYCALHKMGVAHSAEVWINGKLVGGLYGIRLGKIFFGESMFSNQSNASKYAFIQYVEILKKEGVVMIDCQVYTSHLENLGAIMIARNEFMEILKSNI